MRFGRQRARWTTTLLVTLALALQAVFTSLALGQTGEPPLRDAFGHILCISGGEASDQAGGSPQGHGSLPDCCTVACSMFWPQLPAPAGQAALSLPAAIEAGPPAIPVAATASFFLDHRSSHPRAPPMRA